MPSAFVLCGRHGRKRVLAAKCGKGFLLRRVERFERAIGRVHGRRLLLRWLAKRAGGRRHRHPLAASFTVLVFLFNPDERTPARVF